MHFDFKASAGLIRPVNVLLGMLSIFMGAVLTATLQPALNVFLACMSGGAIMAGGNAINDYFDVEIDRINKPHRPIPSARITRENARVWSIILFTLGLFLSIFINRTGFLLAILVSAGLYIYSARLKRTLISGNLAVSLFSATSFVYGGVAVGRIKETVIPAGFAFLFHFGREIIKDIEDQTADESALARTLPIRFGPRAALILATLVFVTLTLFTLFPYFLGLYGKAYLWTVTVGVDLIILVALAFLWLRPAPAHFGRVAKILKADMLVGLVALYLGIQN